VAFALLFPGQGSQFVGMGQELFADHDELLGERSDSILGWSLRDMCLEGPEEALTRTEYAQPALFAISYALCVVFREKVTEVPQAAAGHSLGEYTALAAAGAFSYEDGLRLVALRGRHMASAADRESSGMAAMLGVDPGQAESVVAANQADGGNLQLANLNSPGQIVVAGSAADLDWLAAEGGNHGVRRSIPLKVAGVFHSSYMKPAAEALGPELESVEYGSLDFPVWSNTTAQPHHVGEIVANLEAQVTSPVRFQESLEGMARAGVSRFVHIGPGDVTAGLARKSLSDVEVVTVSTLGDVDEAASTLGTM
jgi:[acyl-carrier-protein] S-malonyltransferase